MKIPCEYKCRVRVTGQQEFCPWVCVCVHVCVRVHACVQCGCQYPVLADSLVLTEQYRAVQEREQIVCVRGRGRVAEAWFQWSFADTICILFVAFIIHLVLALFGLYLKIFTAYTEQQAFFLNWRMIAVCMLSVKSLEFIKHQPQSIRCALQQAFAFFTVCLAKA